MKKLESWQYALCNEQGDLYSVAGKKGYDSKSFIRTFMNSSVAADMDKPFHFMQWAGKLYLIDRLEDECIISKNGNVYDSEVLYWIGYLFRYWHFYTGESSKEIYRQAKADMMNTVYLMYHTMAPELAIDRIKETYLDKNK